MYGVTRFVYIERCSSGMHGIWLSAELQCNRQENEKDWSSAAVIVPLKYAYYEMKFAIRLSAVMVILTTFALSFQTFVAYINLPRAILQGHYVQITYTYWYLNYCYFMLYILSLSLSLSPSRIPLSAFKWLINHCLLKWFSNWQCLMYLWHGIFEYIEQQWFW